LIITIVFMNFYIDLSRVALAPYPLNRPPKEQPIMKRQVLATVLLSVLASSAFALPAAEQAIPQVKADAVQFSQTLARSGSQEQENRDYAKGAVAENGSEQANKRAYTEGVTENGRNRLEEKGLVEGGAEQANERAYTQGVAEGGADRLQELHQAQS
jgi:DNA-binding MarR family transcriptional regulator